MRNRRALSKVWRRSSARLLQGPLGPMRINYHIDFLWFLLWWSPRRMSPNHFKSNTSCHIIWESSDKCTVNTNNLFCSSELLPSSNPTGFWYAIGRLEELEKPDDHEFYCFSAGCLAASALFLEKDYTWLSTVALDLQGQVKNGDIHLYDVLGLFVDQILEETDDSDDISQHEWTSKINVVTTNNYLQMEITKATSIPHLKTLLRQSAFIPFATGFGLHHKGHFDGGFSLLFHPRCTHSITLPFSFDMLRNILNVNMGIDVVNRLYAYGKNEVNYFTKKSEAIMGAAEF